MQPIDSKKVRNPLVWQHACLQMYGLLLDILLFVFGPISYLLTLSILNRPKLSSRAIFYHGIPALFHALFLNIFIGLIIIDALPPFNWNHVGVIYTWLEGAGIFSIGMYPLLSVKTYEQYKRAYRYICTIESPQSSTLENGYARVEPGLHRDIYRKLS